MAMSEGRQEAFERYHAANRRRIAAETHRLNHVALIERGPASVDDAPTWDNHHYTAALAYAEEAANAIKEQDAAAWDLHEIDKEIEQSLRMYKSSADLCEDELRKRAERDARAAASAQKFEEAMLQRVMEAEARQAQAEAPQAEAKKKKAPAAKGRKKGRK